VMTCPPCGPAPYAEKPPVSQLYGALQLQHIHLGPSASHSR
jgi:hypothetical protein